MDRERIRRREERLRTATGIERAKILVWLVNHDRSCDAETVETRAEEAVALTDGGVHPDLAARARMALSRARLATSDPAVALELAEEARGMARSPEIRIEARRRVAIAAIYGGDLDRARGSLEQARAESGEHEVSSLLRARLLDTMATGWERPPVTACSPRRWLSPIAWRRRRSTPMPR